MSVQMTVNVLIDPKTQVTHGCMMRTREPLAWVTIGRTVNLTFTGVDQVVNLVTELQRIGNWLARIEPAPNEIQMSKPGDPNEWEYAAPVIEFPAPVTAVVKEGQILKVQTADGKRYTIVPEEPVGRFPKERCWTDDCDGKPEGLSIYCPGCLEELMKQIPF